jgi:hypothetical protein
MTSPQKLYAAVKKVYVITLLTLTMTGVGWRSKSPAAVGASMYATSL